MIIGIDASRANVREKTGTEWHSWHLIRHMMPMLREHQVRLYVREPLEPGLRDLGPNVEECVLGWPPGLLWSHLRLSWELLWHRPDALFVPADTIPLFHPRRTVTIIHDVAFERFPELYRGRSVQRRIGWMRPFVHAAVRLFTGGRYSASERDYHRWSARHAVRASTTLVTVSEYSKKEIVETLQANPASIVVAPPGVTSPSVYAAITAESITNTLRNTQVRQPFFLYVGRLEKKKNIDILLQSFTLYCHQHSHHAQLVLAGSPGYGWEEAYASVPADIRSQIKILSWQPTTTIHQLEKSALAMVFVSRYEGFGIPPLESLSAGVPVIASTLGSLPEVLGTAALYVDADSPTDIARAMEVIEYDQRQRQEICAAGLTQVAKFTWDRSARIVAATLTGGH